ncbi:MAG: hypothetical protein U1F52_07250 [Burkholderiales bacterium]
MKLPCLSLRSAALALALVAGAAPVLAHEQDEATAHVADMYDCDHPAANAVTRLPEGVSGWSALDCTPLGQRLIPGAGWAWRFPASWTDRPTLPAWAPEASQVAPGPKHFVELTFTRIAEGDLPAMHDRLRKDSFTYQFNFDAPPAVMYRLAARNNEGHEMDIYYPVESDDKVWAIPCVPGCRPEYAFIIERVQR